VLNLLLTDLVIILSCHENLSNQIIADQFYFAATAEKPEPGGWRTIRDPAAISAASARIA
jgi:hypothetical protein